MKKLLIVSVMVLSSLTAQAKGFDDVVEAIANNAQNFTLVEVAKNSFTAEQIAVLTDYAEKESNIWGDTILEGDYLASQDAVTLSSFEKVFEGSKLVAYRIQFFVKSWDTGSCDVDYDALDQENANMDEILKECTLGKIIGTFYVTPRFKSPTRDWNVGEYFEEN